MSKRLFFWIIPVIILIAGICGLIILSTHRTFALDAQYYNGSGFQEIDSTELASLLDEHGSFLVFVYQPDCRTSADFEHIVTEFSDAYRIRLLKISYSTLRNSFLLPELKYYPSLAIYRDGQVVNFLRADIDTDLPAYESVEGLKTWLSQYITFTL